MALAVACDIHPLNNLRVLKYLSGPLGLPQEARDAWYRHWVAEGLAALEAMAAGRGGRFLFGDAPTLADLCLVPQMFNARRFEVPLDAYPTLVRADAEANRLEAFAAAHPDRVAIPPPEPAKGLVEGLARAIGPDSGETPMGRIEAIERGMTELSLSSVEIPSLEGKVSEAEWKIRVDLAAAYRLIAHYGWDDLIFTHLSARVPGPSTISCSTPTI